MTTPTFGTQLIGQTEKTLNAILGRLLTGTAVTEPQWVALQVALARAETTGLAELTSRVATALRIGADEATQHLHALQASGLLTIPGDPAAAVTLTPQAHDLVSRVRAEVAEVTARLWGDLPQPDLALAAQVLSTVLTRAAGELAALQG
jgi:DNA-binding MarR family transcriptional regulator